MPETPKPETRRLRAHDKLLRDVIRRQAGTVSKAILEAVMNSADAGAKGVTISMDASRVVIQDDGHGFRTREEVQTYFEVFGQPHSEFESKTFGTFRMGRGQMMSFGVNTWRTGTFRMATDVEHRDLEYDFEENLPPQPGCLIEIVFYEKQTALVLAQTQSDLQLWCKFAPIEVTFNGTKLNVDLEAQRWDHQTPEAYVKLTATGTLSIYNLGIHVAEFPNHRFGTGGVVVSRKQLAVNFARNDILASCPVWSKVAPFLQSQATKRNLKKPSLDDGGRDNLARQIMLGAIDEEDALGARIFTTVHGRHLRATDLEEWENFTLCPRGNRLGETAMETRRALALSDELLRRFNVDDGAQLGRRIQKNFPGITAPVFVPLETLKEEFPTQHAILKEKQWTPRSAAWMNLLNRLHDGHRYHLGIENRRFVVGSSDTAEAWTDGTTYIAFDEKLLRRTLFDASGLTRIAVLLVHMASHREPNLEACAHDMEFHQRYEESIRQHLPGIVESLVHNAASVVLTESDRLDRKTENVLNRLDRAKRAQEQLGEAEARAPAAPTPPKFTVPAKARTDDGQVEVEFDAGPWFAQAPDDEIRKLARIGWGGDYEADEVAEHFEETATKPLYDYLTAHPVGFECHIDAAAALAWVRAHRPELAKRLEADKAGSGAGAA